jgi:hypothetical protein
MRIADLLFYRWGNGIWRFYIFPTPMATEAAWKSTDLSVRLGCLKYHGFSRGSDVAGGTGFYREQRQGREPGLVASACCGLLAKK